MLSRDDLAQIHIYLSLRRPGAARLNSVVNNGMGATVGGHPRGRGRGPGRLHVYLREGLLVCNEQPGRVRKLPRDARPL